MRAVIAMLLISVALPMTLLLPFHHHEGLNREGVSCELCEHHQPHPAHLSSSAQPDHCLICQFLGIGYLPEAPAEVPEDTAGGCSICTAPSKTAPSVQPASYSTRAPPFSFC